MTECECEKIHLEGAFKSRGEIDNLEWEIKKSGFLKNIPMEIKLYDVGGRERWYSCVKCGRLWGLVYPVKSIPGFWKEGAPE